uniref:Integrase catalytic domain-containing protein n=1 Tax=Fagus sylvatica TaxID=28930 RepID=A0A2N9GC76_FAGSY
MEPSAERLVEFPMVIFAFAIKWREKQVDPDLASKKSGWSLLSEKFDELLSFVQLIAKRNTEDENQRKEDDKDTSEAEPEGHSNTNATPPRPPTPPKPEGKDSQLDSKIDSLEEKIRLIQGLNSFGNTDFSSMSWFPNMTVPPKFKAPEFEKYNGRGDPMIHLQMYCRKMAPYADNEPLLIQTFQDTLTGNAAEWYSQLKKISHWKELADTFLAQYGFNSQIAPDRFDLQRMEKKSNETFREYAQRWREKAARARPPLDEREMIKIFVDTLKNPYFDRMMGLQMQFFVDLIPVGDRIEDALKTKKIVDMTALMALAEQAAKKAPTKRKEGDVQMIGRNNGRPRQAPAPAPAPQMPARPEGNQPNDNSGPQRRDFNPNSACDFHFGEVGHTVENCGQLRHRVQDLIDHGVLKFEGLPNITTNPLPKHPEGGVNMVEVEEGNEESIAWRRLFYTLEKQKHITPLDAPPGPSTGDSCEYHSGARGHSLDCCEEFKKKVTDLMENGIVGREEIPSKGSRQPDDPSDFDWYAEINLDDIVEDEMDLDNLQDEEADWGYFMEDDTDEWRDVDFTEFFQFPCLIVPPGFVTPEFEIFLRGWGSGGPFAKLRNLTGWDDLVRVFLERYRFNPHSILEYLGLKKDEEPYIIPDPGHWLRERKKRSQSRPPPSSIIITTTAEEEDAGPMVEGLSIHTIAEEEDSTTTPPTRHCQQGEEIIPTKKSNYQVTSFEALERQDEGSKPNIEELEIVNLANEGEEPREVKIGTRCAAEQKEALIALLREFHEIFAWSYQDMPGLDTDIVVHKIPLKPECKPVKASTATDEARSHFEDQGRGGKAIEGRFPKHSNLFGLGSQYSPGAEEGRKTTNVVFSFMDGFSGYNQIKMAEEDKSKTAFVTHWGTFVYDVMPFGLKNAGATYQRAMVTLFHDMIHHEIEVYVDDMIAKSRTAQDHLTDLRKLFQATEEASSSAAGELRLILQRFKPYEACPRQRTEKEIRSFLGRINYIARFIAQLTATCEPLFKLLRKDVKIKWTEDCQKAFDKIKEYLLNPPILVPPTPGRPLILYLTVQEASMGCMLGQQDETGKKEQAIYYLSKKFTEPETRYLLVEKTCCALAWASKKLRQYMLYYTTWLVSRNGPDQITRPEQLELMDSEFPDEDVMTVDEDNQGRWKLYFDGAANAVGSGIGAVLVSPKGQQTPIATLKKANRIDPRDARGTNGSPCQRTLPGPEDHESWLLLVDNGEGLHQTCPDVPQMPDVSEQQERTSPISSHYGLAVAVLSLGNGCDRTTFICRYGMPEMLITDNASNLNNRMMDQLCQQFKIQHHNSAPYRPKMNGAVEAANKNVKKILSKMTETYKDWHEHLPYALCAYRTSVRTSVGAYPLLSGIWDGSSTTGRSGDPFFENPVTNSAGRSLNGPKPRYEAAELHR